MLKKLTTIIAIILCAMLVVSFVVPSFSSCVYAANPQAQQEDYSGSAIQIIKEHVAMWYYIIRAICVAVMLILLVFIGINLAIKSATPADRAFYKKMLTDWVAGMVLVFGIHYLMIGILSFNEILVDMIAESGKAMYQAAPSEYGDIRDMKIDPTTGELTDRTNEDIETSIFENLRTRAYEMRLSVGLPGMILYGVFVYFAWKYTLIYLRRVFNIWVLTLLGPPISVSYALNKTLTGKSKLFSTWLREYIMNTFIQSIHALCYVTFTLPVLKFSVQSVVGMLFAIVIIKFMSDADKIVRKIFSVGGGEGSVIGSITDRNIGREAFKNYLTAYKSVAGIGAVKAVANLERKAILAVPKFAAKKGFGQAMANVKNYQVKKDLFAEQKIENDVAAAVRKEFGKNVTINSTKDENGIKRYNYSNIPEEKKAEVEKFKQEKEASLRKEKAEKDKERSERTQRILNGGKVKGDGRTYGEVIDEIEKQMNDDKLAYEQDENLSEQERADVLARIQANELKLSHLIYERDNRLRAQLRIARVGLGEVFDPNQFVQKQVKWDPDKKEYVETGKYVGLKTSHGKRVGFLKYEKERDGMGSRIKKNFSPAGLFNLNEEEKKAFADAKRDIIDSTKVLVGTIGAIVTLGDSSVASGALLGMAATAGVEKRQRQIERVNKMQSMYQVVDTSPNGEEDEQANERALSSMELAAVAQVANIRLAQERDKYIVEDIKKKKTIFTRFLTSGKIHAINGLSTLGGGAGMRMYYRSGSDGTHTVGMGHVMREAQVKKYYEQEKQNKRRVLNEAGKLIANRNKDAIKEFFNKTDEEIDKLSDDDLLMAAAVAQGKAFDTGDEVLNLTGETITEDSVIDSKKSAKEQDGFTFILPVANIENIDNNDRVVTEEEDEEVAQLKTQGQTRIKITKKDAEEAIKAAASKGGFATIAEFGKSNRASRDQAIKILIDNLKKEGVVSGDIESQLSAVTAIGDIIDENLTTMVAREEVNAATVETMEEVVKEREKRLEENPDADVSDLRFENENVQKKIAQKANQRLSEYAKQESMAFSGDSKVGQADNVTLRVANEMQGSRQVSTGDGSLGGRVTANGDVAGTFAQSADFGSSVRATGDAGSTVGNGGDGSRKVGTGTGNVKRSPARSVDKKSTPKPSNDSPIVGKLFIEDDSEGVAGTLESSAKQERASVLENIANEVMQANFSVNTDRKSKVQSTRKLSKDQVEGLTDEIKSAKRIEVAEALARIAEQNTFAKVERVHQSITGEQVSAEPTIEELFERSGLKVDKKLASVQGSDRVLNPEDAERRRQLLSDMLSGFAAYHELQTEKAFLRDYTEYKADSPVLVEIAPKKNKKQKQMYMGMVDNSDRLFGEADYSELAKVPGVGKELNNLVTDVTNAEKKKYSDEDYSAYEKPSEPYVGKEERFNQRAEQSPRNNQSNNQGNTQRVFDDMNNRKKNLQN